MKDMDGRTWLDVPLEPGLEGHRFNPLHDELFRCVSAVVANVEKEFNSLCILEPDGCRLQADMAIFLES